MSGLEGLLTGRTLVKRYRIEEVIGRGGFAVVYRATDESLGRTVAVKVITAPAPDPETRARNRDRFQQEARAAASLSHPNVVTVHDFGTDPTLDIDFLVMEFLHGEDLATYLGRHDRPSLDLALRILVDAACGLAVGHRAGLVHRDVKPGNLFLAEPHGQDPFRVCVLDFGIARASEGDWTLTRGTEGGIALSPAYASPEQARGDLALTPATDVFSLGVVGYQLLTGEKPFSTDRGASPADWVPIRSLRDLAPSVPVEVEAVIRKAMSYAAQDRFPDAAAMAQALEDAVQAGARDPAPAVASPLPPPPEDATLWQPVPATPPRPLTRPVAAPVESRGSGMGRWALILLLLSGVGGLGVWAMSGDGGEDRLDGADVVIPQETQLPAADAGGAVAETLENPSAVEEEPSEPAPLPAASEETLTVAPVEAADSPAAAPGAGQDRARPASGAPQTAEPPPAAGQPARAGRNPAAAPVPPAARQPTSPAQQPRPAATQPAQPDSTPPRLLGDPVRDPDPRPQPRDTTARPRSDTSSVARPDSARRPNHRT